MSEHALELTVAWQRHVADDTALLERLLNRHRERHRRYHRVEHVAWVIRHVDELAATEPVGDHGAVVTAAFYHDAIYEPQSTANERASARLARRDLTELGWDPGRIDHVAEMIEATAGHVAPIATDGSDPSSDVDTAVLLDADLAILGADPAAYREYTDQVRAEYRHLDDATWRTGRAVVLRGLVDRDRIYATDAGRARWEHRARANVAAELAALAG